MAFDGIVLKQVVCELQTCLIGGKVNKVYEPNGNEILLSIYANGKNYTLLCHISSSSYRLHLTTVSKPNPLNAPNFCMLLRKHLIGFRIKSISTSSLERIVTIELEGYNELNDLLSKTLVIELMGKHSNIIFVDEENKIIDSIKHVNGMVSSVREVLPGREYFIPNTMDKMDPFTVTTDTWNQQLFLKPYSISKTIYSSITGFSAVMAHELASRSLVDGDAPIQSLNGNQRSTLMKQYRRLIKEIQDKKFQPCIYLDGPVPKDFSAIPLTMYSCLKCRKIDSVSAMIETFYGEKEIISRIRQKSTDLRKSVITLLERCVKKMDLQQKQLRETEKKEIYKQFGELLNAYGYQLTSKDATLTCMNYYDDKEVTIPVDPALSTSENANRYFKKYNKMKRTQEALFEQIRENRDTIEHLESIITELEIARREEDLQFIRQELIDSGYIKKPAADKGKNKNRMPKSKPLHFISSDGYDIYVGKNNYQNEEITFRLATGNDWWFHAKKMPGSHVIVKCNDKKEPPIRTFEEAASLAAYFSKGKEASRLEIDYTQKKNIKKPRGSKPGFVVYYTNYSLVVSSDIKGIYCANQSDMIFLERSFM